MEVVQTVDQIRKATERLSNASKEVMRLAKTRAQTEQ